jgi:EAL domain-containing protein (putative c-di-GMP-specific phosphodiesterase class I)/CheY-like chemotaxis protein
MIPRVLAIDDNSGILNDFRKILMPSCNADSGDLEDIEGALFGSVTAAQPSSHCDLFTATQGEQGFELFNKERLIQAFDVVFVDMRMPPGWDGLRTIREIWNVEPNQFIVLCSAYSDYSFAELRAVLGNRPNFLILNKPFAVDEVLQIITSVVERESDQTRSDKHMAADLRVAIEDGQLSTMFQPLIDLATGATVGFETLCRWEICNKPIAYPDQFIDVAERYGLIRELGAFVISEAAAMAKELLPGWQNKSFPLVTVNVSPKQLDSSMVDLLNSLTAKTGIPVGALGIEITESGDIASDSMCVGIIRDIQAAGFHILLDDFGTGHSCLANLYKVPFDTVKLDREFCMGLPQCESAALLLQAFGKLLTQLGKTALVEGVETSEQESMVRSYGYNIAQGFYYSRPIRRQIAIERFFDDNNRSDARAA